MGTIDSGFVRLHDNQWQVFNIQNSDLPSNFLTSLLQSTDGAICMGTKKGGVARLLDD